MGLLAALLYQPAWIWIAAPLVMLGGFVGITVPWRAPAKLWKGLGV